ncbi:MAG: lactate utilization protein [Fervidobacterium sp.]
MREELYNWKYEHVAQTLKKSLEKRAFEVHIAKSEEDLINLINLMIPQGATVASGGSLSILESGILDILRSEKYNFIDRAKAKTPEERRNLEIAAFSSDFYLCSANAVTEDGKLIFLDGNGNRVAAIAFGPKNIILVVSVNKVVKNLDEAIERIRMISPMNAKRLELKTPCNATGFCHDCASDQRICNYFLIVESSFRQPKRIKVILTTFELGL